MPIVPHDSNVDEKSTTEIKLKRPSTLVLDCNRVETVVASTSQTSNRTNPKECASTQKVLFRSNSSSLHKRQSTFVPAATTSASNKFKLSSELDQIFVISSNSNNDVENVENYDSIQVIDERRMKNMPKSDRARLYKSNTFICEEYYTTTMDENTDTNTKQINNEKST